MSDRSLRLATVQFTPLFGRRDRNLAAIERLLEPVSADVIVLPELCTTGYFFTSREEVAAVAEGRDGATAAFFTRLARRKSAVVVAGMAERDGERLYNSALMVWPEAPEPVVYRKTHLFYREKECFDPGDTGFFVLPDTGRDLRIGTMVCYDWRFPEACRTLALLGADLVACPANLVTEAWRPVMPVRALENKVYLAVANRAGAERRDDETLHFKGASAVYGPDGEVRCQAGAKGDTVIECRVHPAAARDKSFNPYNDLWQDRRPQFYGPLFAGADGPGGAGPAG